MAKENLSMLTEFELWISASHFINDQLIEICKGYNTKYVNYHHKSFIRLATVANLIKPLQS